MTIQNKLLIFTGIAVVLGCGGAGTVITNPPTDLPLTSLLYSVTSPANALDTLDTTTTTTSVTAQGEFTTPNINAARTHIVFTRVVNNLSQIYISDITGNFVTLLSDGVDERDPAFSNSGQLVYFSRDVDPGTTNDRKIFVMDTNGGNETQLTFPAVQGMSLPHDFEPKPSPNGSQVVFTRSAQGGATHIAIMLSDGSNVTDISPIGCSKPIWSPDGQKIFYIDDTSAQMSKIMRMNPDGSNKTMIAQNAARYLNLSFSPDGTKLAFCAVRATTNFTSQVYTVNIDGTSETQVTNDQARPAWFPTWSNF